MRPSRRRPTLSSHITKNRSPVAQKLSDDFRRDVSFLIESGLQPGKDSEQNIHLPACRIDSPKQIVDESGESGWGSFVVKSPSFEESIDHRIKLVKVLHRRELTRGSLPSEAVIQASERK